MNTINDFVLTHLDEPLGRMLATNASTIPLLRGRALNTKGRLWVIAVTHLSPWSNLSDTVFPNVYVLIFALTH